jgi:hypothetical protein
MRETRRNENEKRCRHAVGHDAALRMRHVPAGPECLGDARQWQDLRSVSDRRLRLSSVGAEPDRVECQPDRQRKRGGRGHRRRSVGGSFGCLDRGRLRECGAGCCHRGRGRPARGCVFGFDSSVWRRRRSPAALRQFISTVHVFEGEPGSRAGAGIQSSFGSLGESAATTPASYLHSKTRGRTASACGKSTSTLAIYLYFYFKACECTPSARRSSTSASAAVAATSRII